VVVDLRLTRPCALLKGFQGNREVSRDSCWSFCKTLEMHVTLARHLYSYICLIFKSSVYYYSKNLDIVFRLNSLFLDSKRLLL
jgi:hypothetical protein